MRFINRYTRQGTLIPLLLIFLSSLPSISTAQNYGFEVPREVVDVYVEPDSSMRIIYHIGFTTLLGYDPIDVVDIGFPTNDYDINTVKAWIDGRRLTDIRVSEYIDIGVEVHLYGDEQIYPGETSILKVEGINYNMVWQDTADEDYASVEFIPTWFDDDFAFGTTDLTVRFYLPSGIEPDEPRWHEVEPTEKAMVDDRVVYTWHIPDACPYEQYRFGASFPKRVITGPIKTQPPFIISLISAIGSFLITALPCLIPVGILIFIIVISITASRRRKMKYFPAKASIEGVGIKRGLTAPEASIVLEYPLNKVLALILFGLIKKKKVKVKSQDPLILKKLSGGVPERKLRKYEKDFLNAIKKNGELSKKKLETLCVDLVKAVNKKMKGFSLIETREYYLSIMNKAWKLLRAAKAPEEINSILEDYTDWMLLDDDFDDKMPVIITGRTIYAPDWWGNTGTSVPAPSTGKGPSVSLPTLPGSSFAHGITSSMSNFANNIVGNVYGFTSAVTSVTNPPPISTSSGGSYGGSSGCACACACAGCACACAGGGR